MVYFYMLEIQIFDHGCNECSSNLKKKKKKKEKINEIATRLFEEPLSWLSTERNPSLLSYNVLFISLMWRREVILYK